MDQLILISFINPFSGQFVSKELEAAVEKESTLPWSHQGKLGHMGHSGPFWRILLRPRNVGVAPAWLLVFGAVSTTINDQGCQHVTGRFESTRMPLSKSAGWPTFVQSHLAVKTVE